SAMAWMAIAAIAIAIVALVVWAAGAGRRAEEQIAAARQELQTSIATQAQGMSAQLNQVMQSVTQQLGQVRQELQSGIASSGQLASEAQKQVALRLQSSTDALVQMSQRIGEVQKTSQDLSQAAQTLQSVLGGAKTRGTLGEVTLGRLLEDALPRGAYEMQYRFASTGAVVDAIVRGGERLLPVDSKFPLEAYRRLAAEGDTARREFSAAVRKHADSIAEKYILPDERTLDYAMMFVPSEGVYYELLRTEDSKYGLLDEYCRSKRVFPVSPNTFYACLSAIAVSLQGQKIEENARHLLDNMAGLKKQLESFGEVYEKLGTHLRHAQQSYEDADSRLSRARNSVEQMSQGALPEPAAKLLDAATRG
ncbi:MAG: DNA recombination protein RmuC, partial [Acidobacteriota bacterium]|nr:DNA recombination protein RmuC [Acidobacteriota bacterium]